MTDGYVAVTCTCKAEGRIPTGVSWFEASDALKQQDWHCTDGTWRCNDCYGKWQKALTLKVHHQAEKVKKELETAR